MAVRLEVSERFVKRLRSLDATAQDAVLTALSRFELNERHPSLHFKKLVGSEHHTFRATKSIRIVLSQLELGVFVAVDVGTHDVIRRY